MTDQDDEQYFSDTSGGLNDLPQSTLQDLESHALSSTQQNVAALRAKQYGQVTDPLHLSRSTTAWQQTVPTRPSAATVPHPPSSDYGGLDDEDVIDLNGDELLIQNASGPPPRVKPFDPDPAVTHTDLGHGDAQRPQRAFDRAQPIEDLAFLEARIRDLEHERANLQLSVQTAEAAALKTAGEIAIIRAKNDKDTKEYERRIAVIQKLHADESAKHRSEAQAALRDRATIETNNRFLEHDLAQEAERRKRFKPAKEPAGQPHTSVGQPDGTVPPLTSTAVIPYRDGFDDHEIVLVSPSKPKDRAKPETPKAGEKRKRNVNPSPVRPLALATSHHQNSSPLAPVDEQGRVEDVRRPKANSPFRSMQQIINHRPPRASERTLETLAKYNIPSRSGTSVAALVIDAITRYVPADDATDLSMYFCKLLLDLWADCLKDHYYSPMRALADLLEFVLALGPCSTMNELIDQFVPLATKSIDLIAVPLARPSEQARTTKARESNPGSDSTPSEHIDVDQILSIMHTMAMAASVSADTNRTFWQKMEFDFTLMMLNIPQELPHMQLILQMVGASVLPDSFGVISQQPDKQASLEMHTLDRLTNLLFEQPRAPQDEPPYENTELAALQIEAVRTLIVIAATRRGSIALAQHRTAVGRLIRFLHIQITSLYDLPLNSFHDIDGELASGVSTVHKLTTALINLTVRLAHQLLHQHADLINLRDKLAVIPGGHHKFLVSLTRLAFSEQLVYEAGIDEEAVDAAHEILDHILTPEEGDAVVEAIETPRGTNMTRASAPG